MKNDKFTDIYFLKCQIIKMKNKNIKKNVFF